MQVHRRDQVGARYVRRLLTRVLPVAAVRANLCLAQARGYPRVLAAPHLKANEVVEFDPSFVPPALEFTASYLAEPRSFLVENSAEIARDVAMAWHASHPE